jgi:hypothetical protein
MRKSPKEGEISVQLCEIQGVLSNKVHRIHGEHVCELLLSTWVARPISVVLGGEIFPKDGKII